MPKWRNWDRKNALATSKTTSDPVFNPNSPRAGNCPDRRLMVGDIVRPNRYMYSPCAFEREYTVLEVYQRTVVCRGLDGEYYDYRFNLVRAADE